MPICNPIKCSAALLQSRYDSLLPREMDRESGATQMCLFRRECFRRKTNKDTEGETELACVYMQACVFDPISRTRSESPQALETTPAGRTNTCQSSRPNLI